MMGYVDSLIASISDPLLEILNGVVMSLPGIIAALIIILIGYLVGWAVSLILRRIFEDIKFDKWLVDKTGLHKVSGEFKFGETIAIVAKWWIFVIFLPPAAEFIQLDSLSLFLQRVALIIPNIILAIIILFFGLIVGNYVAEQIRETRIAGSHLVADLVKFIFYTFATIIALEQAGLQISLAKSAVLIILAGIVAGVALATGLAFGLGMKQDAQKWGRKFAKKL